jgi:hypothetical protein
LSKKKNNARNKAGSEKAIEMTTINYPSFWAKKPKKKKQKTKMLVGVSWLSLFV